MRADESERLRTLGAENPWWVAGKARPAQAKPFRRRDFFQVRAALGGKPIVAIVGPRQVGKTTLMYQLIEDLLDGGTPARNILFASFDFVNPAAGQTDLLSATLETYEGEVLRRPLGDEAAPVHVFLDEVTKLPEWHRALKWWFDRLLPLKFVITDSSHVEVIAGMQSSLVGRCTQHRMLPMPFAEVVAYHEKSESAAGALDALREGFARALARGSAAGASTAFATARRALFPVERRIEGRFRDYLLKGGQPELLDDEDWRRCESRLREYVGLVLGRDLLRHLRVRDPTALDGLVALLAEHSGQTFEVTGLARDLGVSLEAVRAYLGHFEVLDLAMALEFHAKSRAARMRKQRKVYFTNVGLGNAVLRRLDPSLFERPDEVGRVVETVVADHCRRMLEAEAGPGAKLRYWRNRARKEVDIVIPLRRGPVPVEVKYQPRVTNADIRPVMDFLEEHEGAPFGVVVTRGEWGREGKVLKVPAHWFVLAA